MSFVGLSNVLLLLNDPTTPMVLVATRITGQKIQYEGLFLDPFSFSESSCFVFH